MALILPHPYLEGSYAIAERVRTAIEALAVPRLDGSGVLRVTVSLGVEVTTEGDKEGDADRDNGCGALRGKASREESHRPSQPACNQRRQRRVGFSHGFVG